MGTPEQNKRFRSGFEKYIAEGLLKKSKARYESRKITYPKVHIYTPDWELPNGIFLEAKGRLTTGDRSKHLIIKAEHPQLDIRFIFKVNNKIYKDSNTRYADWCDRHGFLYCFTNAPVKSGLPIARLVLPKWLKEPKKQIITGRES